MTVASHPAVPGGVAAALCGAATARVLVAGSPDELVAVLDLLTATADGHGDHWMALVAGRHDEVAYATGLAGEGVTSLPAAAPAGRRRAVLLQPPDRRGIQGLLDTVAAPGGLLVVVMAGASTDDVAVRALLRLGDIAAAVERSQLAVVAPCGTGVALLSGRDTRCARGVEVMASPAPRAEASLRWERGRGRRRIGWSRILPVALLALAIPVAGAAALATRWHGGAGSGTRQEFALSSPVGTVASPPATPAEFIGTSPAGRILAGVAAADGRVFVVGGIAAAGGVGLLNSTVALALTPGAPWTSVTGSQPSPARGSPAMAADPAGGLLVFGGASDAGGLSDVWRLDSQGWTRLASASQLTFAGCPSSAAPVPGSGVLLVSVCTLQANSATGAARTLVSALRWTDAAGFSPAQDMAGVDLVGRPLLALDPVTGRLLCMGTSQSARAAGEGPLAVWRLDPTGWARLRPAHHPVAFRSTDVVASDTRNHVLVLYDDGNGSTTTWDGHDWTDRTTHITPVPNVAAGMVTGPLGQVLLLGGPDPADDLSQRWTWDGLEWTLLAP